MCCSNFYEDEALLRVPWGRPSLDCYHWFAGEVKGYPQKMSLGSDFFSLKVIEIQFLNYEENEEDFREKTAGQQTLHKLKQAMKMCLHL